MKMMTMTMMMMEMTMMMLAFEKHQQQLSNMLLMPHSARKTTATTMLRRSVMQPHQIHKKSKKQTTFDVRKY